MTCSLAEELVTAAQAVESGKGLERKLSSLQTEFNQVRLPGSCALTFGVLREKSPKIGSTFLQGTHIDCFSKLDLYKNYRL